MSDHKQNRMSRRQVLRLFATGGAIATGGAVLAACGGQTSAPAAGGATAAPAAAGSASAPAKLDQATLKIMLPGDVPENFVEVIAEAEKRMADTVNAKLNVSFVPFSDLSKLKVTLQSGEDIDLIFDAPWVGLSQNIAQGFYANIEDMLPKYAPNVVKTRPQQMWDANRYGNGIYGIPLGAYHYQGRSWEIRKDLREKLGIAPIKTVDDLEKLLYAAKEKLPDMVPLASTVEIASHLMYNDFDTSLRAFSDVNPILYLVGNDGKMRNEFKERDEEVFWKNVQRVRKWYNDGLIPKDILSAGQNYSLQSGKSVVQLKNDFVQPQSDFDQVKKLGGEVEVVNFFDKSKKKIISFHQWNFISVADVSKNKERALMFLDWAHQQDNYDLLAYGIKGKNWEDPGPGLYKPLAATYRWFPYGWLWNPTLDRENALAPQDGLEWDKWAKDANNFTPDLYVGFNPDTTKVTDQMSQTGAMKSDFWKPLMYGATDPDNTWADYQTKAGPLYDQIQADFEKQAADFKAKKG